MACQRALLQFPAPTFKQTLDLGSLRIWWIKTQGEKADPEPNGEAMLKANGQRTSPSDRGVKQPSRTVTASKRRMFTWKKEDGIISLSIFSFPVALETGNWPPHPIEQEDAATYRCRSQVRTESRPLGPHGGWTAQKPTAARSLPRWRFSLFLTLLSLFLLLREWYMHRNQCQCLLHIHTQRKTSCFVAFRVQGSTAGNAHSESSQHNSFHSVPWGNN